MIFGIQLSFLGAFMLFTTAPNYNTALALVGFLLIFVGIFLGLAGLVMKTAPNKL
jgi:uncharacterized membrane protein HdeD (DUF308 family)